MLRAALMSLVAGLAIAGCGGLGDEPLSFEERPIIGGTASAESFLSGVGALVVTEGSTNTAYCTATLISETLVLTAAHCIEEGPTTGTIGFFTGRDIRAADAASRIVPVASLKSHPDYTGTPAPPPLSLHHDIGMAVLARPCTASPVAVVRPAEVASLVKKEASVLIVGYGRTRSSDFSSSGAKYQGTTTIDDFSASELHIRGETNPQKCKGDSGGPTLGDADPGAGESYRVIGVTSRAGSGCVQGSTETRVDYYLDWIHTFGALPCGSGKSADCAALGKPCIKAADCASKLCVAAEGAKVCAQSCDLKQPSCPTGFTCASLEGAGACLAQPKKALGETCSEAAECQSGICGESGDVHYCTRTCTPEEGCGDEMHCNSSDGGSFCAPRSAPTESGDGGGGCGLVPTRSPLTWAILLCALPLLGLAVRTRRSRSR